MKKSLPIVFPIIAFVLPLFLYLCTLAPTYVPIDAAEFTLCVRFWGICHPPGFPLYIMVGHFLAKVLPFSNYVYRVNFLSGLYGALTILFIYLSLIRLWVKKESALLLSLFFAITSIFWEYSLSADVFSFSTFLTALTFFLVLTKRKYLAFFMLGLSTSHFYLSAVLAPVFVWYFDEKTGGEPGDRKTLIHQVWNFRFVGFRFGDVFQYALIFAAGLFPQAVMYWRMQVNPEINWGHAQGLLGFYNFVRRKEFGSIFLIANPVLTFSIVKTGKHIWHYFFNLFVDFGVIVPFVTLVSLGFWKFLKRREIAMLVISFVISVSVQLFLLSTIEPGGADNPFQLDKFYLTSFVIFVLIAGSGFTFLFKRLFDEDQTYILLILGLLIAVFFLANIKTHNYSKNDFTQRWVTDVLSHVEPNSIVITVDHPMYFGGLYEQKVNHKFRDLTLLYFPNEKNMDGWFYQKEVFNRPVNQEFVDKIKSVSHLGRAEENVLDVVAKNLDRPIYIVQGNFEAQFFGYLKPYIVPGVLSWKVVQDPHATSQFNSFEGLSNVNFVQSDFSLRQQGFEAQDYAISYFEAANALAARGQIEKALEYLNKSNGISPQKNVQDEIGLFSAILESKKSLDLYRRDNNEIKLSELGNNYFTAKDYSDSVEIFEILISINKNDARNYNNAASSYAYLGNRDRAREYYKKAIELDPKLDLAKQGLATLDSK